LTGSRRAVNRAGGTLNGVNVRIEEVPTMRQQQIVKRPRPVPSQPVLDTRTPSGRQLPY
jgi:hypothetical protein